MSEQESDLLLWSTTKVKKDQNISMSPTCKVSFLESLQSTTKEPDINYVTQGLDNINLQDEHENPQNHPNFISITTGDKL